MTNDPRVEAGARALCAFHGVNPDEPALKNGEIVPLWQMYALQTRVVLAAADATDVVTPEMERAGTEALAAGSHNSGSLVQKIWAAMAALRTGGSALSI